jgi:hypothetical protein
MFPSPTHPHLAPCGPRPPVSALPPALPLISRHPHSTVIPTHVEESLCPCQPSSSPTTAPTVILTKQEPALSGVERDLLPQQPNRHPSAPCTEVPRPYPLDKPEHVFYSTGKRHSEVGLRAWAARSPARRGAPSSQPGAFGSRTHPRKVHPLRHFPVPSPQWFPRARGNRRRGCSEAAYRVGARSSLVRSHR